MNKIIKIVGSIVVSVIMYAIPILTACSFAYAWDGFVRLILTLASLTQLVCLAFEVFFKGDTE